MKARQDQKMMRRLRLRLRDGMDSEEAGAWAALESSVGGYVRPLKPGDGRGKIGTRLLRDAWICRMSTSPEAEVRHYFAAEVVFSGPAWECVRLGLGGHFDIP